MSGPSPPAAWEQAWRVEGGGSCARGQVDDQAVAVGCLGSRCVESAGRGRGGKEWPEDRWMRVPLPPAAWDTVTLLMPSQHVFPTPPHLRPQPEPTHLHLGSTT
eukprot:156943-Chlamydomonas_euryale.AAC.2